NKRRVPAARLIQCAWRCYASSINSRSTATWKACTRPSAVGKKSSSKLSLSNASAADCGGTVGRTKLDGYHRSLSMTDAQQTELADQLAPIATANKQGDHFSP